MRKPSSVLRRLLVLLAVAPALVVAACGSDEGDGGESGPSPAVATPPEAALYLEAEVRPEGDLDEGLDSALGKLTGEEDPGSLIRGALDRELADLGLSYSEDVEPWLGATAGLFLLDLESDPRSPTAITDGNGAVLLASSDDEAARAAIEKAASADDQEESSESYAGYDYLLDRDGTAIGIVDGFVVAGTEDGFRAAADAGGGTALADDGDAAEALDSVPEGSLFTAYLDLDAIIDIALDTGQISERDLEGAGAQLDQLRDGPVVLSGQVTEDSISFEASGPAGAEAMGTELIATLPSGSWLALSLPDIGESISQGFESLTEGFKSGLESGGLPPGTKVPDIGAEIERAIGIDLSKDLAWAGDMAAFAAGGSPLDLGAGIVIETDDEAAASTAVEKVGRRLASQRGSRVRPTADGFEVSGLAGAPVGAEVAVRDGKLLAGIAGVSIEDLLNPSETLEQAPGFTDASDALGDLDAALFVDFPPILALAESTGQTGDPDFQQAEPVLDALDYLIAGSGEEDDRSVARLVLGLKEPSSGSGSAATIVP